MTFERALRGLVLIGVIGVVSGAVAGYSVMAVLARALGDTSPL